MTQPSIRDYPTEGGLPPPASAGGLRSLSFMKLFVYGTLKRGGRLNCWLSGCPFVGEARTVRGYTLVSLGVFPAMVRRPGGGGVTGEIYEVDGATLEWLDLVESGYERVVVPLVGGGAAAYVMRNEWADELPSCGSTWSNTE